MVEKHDFCKVMAIKILTFIEQQSRSGIPQIVVQNNFILEYNSANVYLQEEKRSLEVKVTGSLKIM